MALITRSIEMSFSASRLRRTVTSMSIWSLLVRTAGGLTESVEAAGACRFAGIVLGRQAAELHLHPAWSERAVAHLALRTVDLQQDALLIGVDHSCLMLNGTSGHVPLRIMILIGERDDDQPADRAPPVPGLGQRPVDTRRGHLERVGRVAHRVPRVEPGRQLAADLGDVIEADSAVGVHHDAQHPAAPDGPCLTRGAATGVLAHHASSPTTWTCLPGSSLAGTAARRSDLLLFAA